MIPFESVNIESAPKQISRQIREAILDGTLKPEQRLPTEEELATSFNVSRASIREALKRLAVENLVVVRRGAQGGNFVRAPSRDDVRRSIAEMLTVAVSFDQFDFDEIIATRSEFGLMCCRMAVNNRTDEDLSALKQEIALQRDPTLTDAAFCATDVRFHCRLAVATGNALIAATVSGVFEGLETITNLMLFRFRERSKIADQHQLLVNALDCRDLNAASAAICEQITYLREKHADASLWQTKKSQELA